MMISQKNLRFNGQDQFRRLPFFMSDRCILKFFSLSGSSGFHRGSTASLASQTPHRVSHRCFYCLKTDRHDGN